MKRVVLNCKNSLFVGNPRGGRTAAILASLTSSWGRHEMDPQLYFMQLLMNLPWWPANDIDAWLPDRRKQAHADRCAALEISPLDSWKLIERVVVSGCLLAIDFLAMADAKDKNDQAVFDRSTMLLHKGQ
jgi:hypothetical protein